MLFRSRVQVTSACKLSTAKKQAQFLRCKGYQCEITQNIYFLGFHIVVYDDPDYWFWIEPLYKMWIEIENPKTTPFDKDFNDILRYPYRIYKDPQLTWWQKIKQWFGVDVLKIPVPPDHNSIHPLAKTTKKELSNASKRLN